MGRVHGLMEKSERLVGEWICLLFMHLLDFYCVYTCYLVTDSLSLIPVVHSLMLNMPHFLCVLSAIELQAFVVNFGGKLEVGFRYFLPYCLCVDKTKFKKFWSRAWAKISNFIFQWEYSSTNEYPKTLMLFVSIRGFKYLLNQEDDFFVFMDWMWI